MTSHPIFILSGPRSGSTLLRYILDTHSQIASPGEIALGTLCRSLAEVIQGTEGEALRLTREERDQASNRETREIVDRIMGAYLALKGKRLWCEKSVSNVRDLSILSGVFPDALYVCLYRDCLDTIHSCLDAGRLGFVEELSAYVAQQPRNLIAAMMSSWIDNTTLILEFERQNGDRCFRIRYEDLVTSPSSTLRPLLSFVGADWEDELLASVFTLRHDQGGGDLKILFSKSIEPTRVGSGQRINLALIPDALKSAADPLLQALSYPALAPGRQLSWLSAATMRGAGEATASPARRFIESGLAARLRQCGGQAGTIQGSCRLVLQGQGGGSWTLDFSGDVPAVVADAGAADCSLFLSVRAFEELVAGRLDPAVALWESKVTADGDFELARKVGQLLWLAAQNQA